MIIVVILLLAIFGIMLPPVDSTNKIAIFGGKKPSLLGKPLSLSWLEHHFEPSVARGQLCQSFCVIDKFHMKHHQLVTIAKILSLLSLRNGRMLW